jgi:hypothetical protein
LQLWSIPFVNVVIVGIADNVGTLDACDTALGWNLPETLRFVGEPGRGVEKGAQVKVIFFDENEGISSSGISVATFSDVDWTDCTCSGFEIGYLVMQNRRNDDLVERICVDRRRGTRMSERMLTSLEGLSN